MREQSVDIDKFKDIDDKMLWKKEALGQIESFKALAERLNSKLEVVSRHRSKSIILPVVRFTIADVEFYIRDNFYDYNLCVISPDPIELTISQLMEGIQEAHDWDWYLGEINKCRHYTWDYFTDEEMDDPNTLCVLKVHKHGKSDDTPMEWVVRRDEKDNWLKRMTSPDWWMKNWSSGKLCWEGEFGPGVKFFIQGHPFMEGIGAVVPGEASKPYEKGCRMFALELGKMEQVETLIRKLSIEEIKDGNEEG